MSYGYAPLNEKLPCPLMRQLVADMRRAVKREPGYPRITTKFGHSHTVVGLETFLGLFKDPEKLAAHTPIQRIQERKFRMAQIVSEQPVILPESHSVLCPFEMFYQVVEPKLHCDYAALCYVPTSEAVHEDDPQNFPFGTF
ncbi:uncharacterized protein BYT42DRAFT_550021 [Radiomyces spectabilis]|uniref:uncharacterized protein n=1 Tax=Radiomyces spectabilis TaxID=64574 RepID=UPI00221EAC38|nr:uncharacterized protein BYT42DRAFT_550021 [Radiomyces spectabilis]KAI8366047.1 hypothetical protein BYT42DRAFT_550021 [Radiomyces spectabilis]